MALWSILMMLKLDSKQKPLTDAQGKYPKAIQQVMEGYKGKDPPKNQN